MLNYSTNTASLHIHPIEAHPDNKCDGCPKTGIKLFRLRGFRSRFCWDCLNKQTDNLAAEEASETYDRYHIWGQGN